MYKIDAKKKIWQNSVSIQDKHFQEISRSKLPELKKGSIKSFTAKISVMVRDWMFFPLGSKQERLLKLFLFNFVLEFLAKVKKK